MSTETKHRIDSRTMTAWQQTHYGGPETLRATEVAVPEAGKGEVLLKIHATALNAGDIRILRGDPGLVRLAFGLTRPRTATRGMDVAGTIVAVGPGVDTVAVGDEVICELPGGGGLAPYATAPASRLVARPETLDPVAAATLPIAGGTAVQALDGAGVSRGSRVLVIGASGGVGTFAVQLAALRGADVHAVCGARNRTLVKGLGAQRTFDYTTTNAASLPAASYDAIIDIAGAWSLRDVKRLLRPGGATVLVSGQGGRLLGPMGRILGAMVRSIGSKRPFKMLAATWQQHIVAQLAQLAAEDRITPVIERTFTFEEGREAIAHVDSGHTVGKVVVAVTRRSEAR